MRVRIGKSDFPGVSEVVFKILPADARRKIFDDDAIISAHWRRELRRATAAVVTIAVASAIVPSIIATTIVAVVTAAPVATRTRSGRSFRVLDGDPLATQGLVVHFIDRVFRVAQIVEFDKAEAGFHADLVDSAKAFKKSLDITFPRAVTETPDKDTTTGHCGSTFTQQ